MFSLESPQRGDSYEYTQYTIFDIKKKITLIYPKSAAKGFCSKNEFETAMVNELSVFEPMKFYRRSTFRRINFAIFIFAAHLSQLQRCMATPPSFFTIFFKGR